ncbi:MAG: relaxase domain-containing protein [Actinomycetota bacterium]|nr:relaxase domain-containing protein [Actinomycetota bacterium]
MRATTLKASPAALGGLIAYYAGLATDQARRDGVARGPIDYYLDPAEPPGRWWGGGCAALSLGDEVRAEQLEALLVARHPGTGARLGRGFGTKSARAFDATFSAPKSVSVLWALSTDPFIRAEVLAAHDTAVMAALEWFEQHGAVTRRGTNGVDQVDTQGVVVAVFRQHTSRCADPHLHTHAIVVAKVQDPSGKWLSLDARFLKRQQRSIGWIYATALRAELSARLGLSWGPLTEGHRDVEGIPAPVLEEFSQRSEQVEARLAESVADWVEGHDGAEPDPRTLYRLERQAVLDSRPDKEPIGDAEALRASWCRRAAELGVEALELPAGQAILPGTASIDREAIVARALAQVAAQSSTWLAADLAREIATLVPADATASAAEVVALVDELAEDAAGRCVELHRPAPAGTACRRDGRPLSEHVVDRQLTTPAVWDQEARLLAWAGAAAGPHIAGPQDGDAQAEVARAVAGTQRLVLVVGPAGAGKTTALGQAAHLLADQARPALGLAPSGKAADVLAHETGWPATTLAKLLHEHARPGGPRPGWRLPAGTTVVLDEAAMASTEDLDALVGLVQRHGWRLVCVGDPAQLPAVGRGGMFALWCERLPAHHLEEVRRFADDWQAGASLALRRGEPAGPAAYAAHHRLRTVHPALVADRVARQFERLAARGASVAVTCASAGTARAINVEIQRRRNPRQQGASVALADGSRAFVGDRVATRRNVPLVTDTGSAVRNRQSWTVTEVGEDGSVVLAHPARGSMRLPAAYVARHVELGWAVTGYGTQGMTTDHAIAVVEPSSTRAGVYVALTRGRNRNLAWIVDRTGLADAEEALAAAIARPPNAMAAHAMAARLGGTPPEPVLEEDAARRMARRLDQLAVGQPGRSLSR